MGADSSSCFSNKAQGSKRHQINPDNRVPTIRIFTVERNDQKNTLAPDSNPIYKQCKKASFSSTNTDDSNNSSSSEKELPEQKQMKKQDAQIAYSANSKISDFKLLNLLGKGHYSHVMLASKKVGQMNVMSAMKIIKRQDIKSKEILNSIQLEKHILENSKSPFIPRIHGSFGDQGYYYLAMEWAEGGDSYSLIKKGSKRLPLFKKAGEKAVRFLLGCIILGLEELHKHGILFADLKPENVLLYSDGYAKLTDFGLSKKLNPHEKIEIKNGSPLYIAPEVINGQLCGLQLDLWSLGILTYEMVNQITPFGTQVINKKSAFNNAIFSFNGVRAWHKRDVSTQLKDLVHGLLRANPQQRLGAKGFNQIKQHAFFKVDGFNWEDLANKKIVSPLLPILKEKIEMRPASDADLGFGEQASYKKFA